MKHAGMPHGGGLGSVLPALEAQARPAYDAARQMGVKGNALGTVVPSKSMNAPVMPRLPGHTQPKLGAMYRRGQEAALVALKLRWP